jgi:pSer/pThr/pTyr-binding forkhead associated (FHA) protein
MSGEAHKSDDARDAAAGRREHEEHEARKKMKLDGRDTVEDPSDSVHTKENGADKGSEQRERGVQGYLSKCGSGGDIWRKRWFTLVGSQLASFRGKRAVLAKHPGQQIDIAGGSVYLDMDERGVERRLSIVASAGSLLLEAQEPAHALQWHAALSEAVARAPEPNKSQHTGTKGTAPSKRNRPPAQSTADGVATLLVLEVVDGPWEGSRFEIGSEGATICRNPSGVSAIHHRNLREVHIPDNDISRRHAEISCEEGVFSVRDLGSLNGTYVNAVRLSEERKPSTWRELSGGDTLTMGKSKMSVFFRVKVLNEVLSKEEIEKRRRKAERRQRREQRREERASRRLNASNKPASSSSSSKVAATATALLQDVLGCGLNPPGQSAVAATRVATAAAPSLRPNKDAMHNILGAVFDHNERLDDEQDYRRAKNAEKHAFTAPRPETQTQTQTQTQNQTQTQTPSWLSATPRKVASLPPPPAPWLQPPPSASFYPQYHAPYDHGSHHVYTSSGGGISNMHNGENNQQAQGGAFPAYASTGVAHANDGVSNMSNLSIEQQQMQWAASQQLGHGHGHGHGQS